MQDGIKKVLTIIGSKLSTCVIKKVIENNLIVEVSEDAVNRINESRELLNKFIENNRVIYGVNTSCGGFVNWLIPDDYAQEFQENLIAAVATNVGSYLGDDDVRASILIRLNSLAKGASAISLENFNKLLEIYNAGIIPCIPAKGSLGASGDLGPLACIALVATGKWKAKYNGKIVSGGEALKLAGITPMKLGYKEGLSLINGTSVMAGVAALVVEKSIDLLKIYQGISCLTFEALKVKKKPFAPVVHYQKQHLGQRIVAENIWKLLEDSNMIVGEESVERELQQKKQLVPIEAKASIEDAYSIRCTPHILGPIIDNLKTIRSTITNEINSSSDNPLILVEENDVFHNGHFHGQYIAMAMDQLSISLTTLSNLSDRRIDRFMDKNHSNNLPGFLCKENPGLRLGLMGGQFMATSLTAENRSLCTPLSIQTLTSTGDFQDVVSMGLIAARRAQEIYNNTTYIVAFELMCACQAAEIRGDIESLSTATKCIYDYVRSLVPYLSIDQPLTDHLEVISNSLKTGEFVKQVKSVIDDISF
ncbi:MAG: Tyrosine ammonia-lyase [Chlamydiia bacterium]|nr:Tyrosine ammonia-lyase [Chlamydiia bacterium]MCH9618972.1 Tyrosine ammonia-lyase [Chlamydiia bacterium]MCH9623814.1 Tyrosine ammonia-lyase [Chlamydiia bacterium]